MGPGALGRGAPRAGAGLAVEHDEHEAAAPPHPKEELRGAASGLAEVLDRPYASAVRRGDHVPGAKPRVGGGALALDVGDDDPRELGGRLDAGLELLVELLQLEARQDVCAGFPPIRGQCTDYCKQDSECVSPSTPNWRCKFGELNLIGAFQQSFGIADPTRFVLVGICAP